MWDWEMGDVQRTLASVTCEGVRRSRLVASVLGMSGSGGDCDGLGSMVVVGDDGVDGCSSRSSATGLSEDSKLSKSMPNSLKLDAGVSCGVGVISTLSTTSAVGVVDEQPLSLAISPEVIAWRERTLLLEPKRF